MALVSPLYRLVPSEAYPNKDEALIRLRMRLRRIVETVGRDEAVRRIQAWRARDEDEHVRQAWLVLEAGSVRNGHRAGTM